MSASCPCSSPLSWELHCCSWLSAASFSCTRRWAASRSASRCCRALLSTTFSSLSASSRELSSKPFCEHLASEQGFQRPCLPLSLPQIYKQFLKTTPLELPEGQGLFHCFSQCRVRVALQDGLGPLWTNPVASRSGPIHSKEDPHCCPTQSPEATPPSSHHTCSVRLRASCTRTSSPALSSSSLLNFSSWSLCSSSWDRTACHGGSGLVGQKTTAWDLWTRDIPSAQTPASPAPSGRPAAPSPVPPPPGSAASRSAAWQCLRSAQHGTGSRSAPLEGPLVHTRASSPTFLSSSACVLMSSLCFSFSLL